MAMGDRISWWACACALVLVGCWSNLDPDGADDAVDGGADAAAGDGDGGDGDGDGGDGDGDVAGDGDGDGDGDDAPACGDGTVDGGEQCDDGAANADAPDACRTDCTAPSCGDGIVDTNEDCDQGNNGPNGNPNYCDVGCVFVGPNPGCGNGVQEQGEECDDGNVVDDDACTSGCLLPRCGDGIVGPAEGCDDGNRVNTDACPDGAAGTCQPAACGDGFRRLGAMAEGCDDGNVMAGDGCSDQCVVEVAGGVCGDGVKDAGEECDMGPANDDQASGLCNELGGTVCRTNCRCPACGDGVADFAAGEGCDDGGLVAGDGCDAMCQIEPSPTCGDGKQDLPGEECDDGGRVDGDGCDAACQLEPVGATCDGGALDPGEACETSLACADGGGCMQNGDCAGVDLASFDDTSCMPRCNPTCNLEGRVTTLLDSGGNHVVLPGQVVALDDDAMWILGGCQIHRLDLGVCLSTGNCTVTAVAGGACGAPVDGTGNAAVIGQFGQGIVSDGSRVYFTDTHTIRALDVTNFDVVTLAGDPNACGWRDGTGAGVVMDDVRGLTYFAGLVYFVEGNSGTLRQLDPNTGQVTTVAGDYRLNANAENAPTYACNGPNRCCGAGDSLDGFGTAGHLDSARYIANDGAGTLYMVDTNGNRVRSYNVYTGYLGTVVGPPSNGGGGGGAAAYTDGDLATARLERARGIASDGTSIYWYEQWGHTVRQSVIVTGNTTTFVGTRGCVGGFDGTGGDGSQCWGDPGGNNNYPCQGTPDDCHDANFVAGVSDRGWPEFAGSAQLAFHYATASLYVIENSGIVRRIQ